MEEISKSSKEGERIVGPTRRPDGSYRKSIRIRPGYTPPDEVPIYQSKGAILKKEMAAMQAAPPGCDIEVVAKPKSKAAKRNERKKEKRHQQAALGDHGASSADGSEGAPDHVESVASQMSALTVSATPSTTNPRSSSVENGKSEEQVQDIDKKIRALKKKIRLAEAQQEKTAEKDMTPEQLEKMEKLDGWRQELKLLEEK